MKRSSSDRSAVSRRGPIVLGATALGLAGVLSYRTHPVQLALANGSTPTGSTTPTTPTTTVTPSSSAPTTTTVAPTTTLPSANSGVASSSSPTTTVAPTTTTVAPTTTTVAPTTTTTVAPSTTRSATGSDVNYFYGDLAVRVTVTGTTIKSVTIATLNDGGNPRSASIDEFSIPQLEQQAVAANSANIQGVSGASYTTQGFEQSLQSALKSLGI